MRRSWILDCGSRVSKDKGLEKPDNIVYDGEKYHSSILPYGSNVSAPAIKTENIDLWKSQGVHKVNKQFQAKYNEIKEEYENLIEEYRYNEIVYGSKFSFEPVIGETYHLYMGNDNQLFLSMISPNEWNKEHMGSFRLNSERKWQRTN